jgi:hypothetical protein
MMRAFGGSVFSTKTELAIRWSCVGIAILTQGSISQAQSVDCTVVKDDKERLVCFDQAAKQTPKVVPQKAADDPLITKARSAVANSLKDPPSARFEGVVRKAEAICGFVNGKHSYGGYVGKTRFGYVLKSGEVFLEVPISQLTTTNLTEYEASDAALKRYCPGVKSPFIRE